MKKRKTKKKLSPAEELKQSLPPVTNWNTTDEHEINRRRLRAIEEPHRVAELLTRALAEDQQPAAPPQQETAGADLEAKPDMRPSATS